MDCVVFWFSHDLGMFFLVLYNNYNFKKLLLLLSFLILNTSFRYKCAHLHQRLKACREEEYVFLPNSFPSIIRLKMFLSEWNFGITLHSFKGWLAMLDYFPLLVMKVSRLTSLQIRALWQILPNATWAKVDHSTTFLVSRLSSPVAANRDHMSQIPESQEEKSAGSTSDYGPQQL